MNIFEADLLPMQVWAKRAEDKLNQWAGGKSEGMPTGFATLDPYLRAAGGEYTLVAARPSMGKTSLGMQVAQNMARQLTARGDNGCVAVFSAEMAGTELTLRMASALCGVNVHQVRNGYGKLDDIDKLKERVIELSRLPIWIDDSSGPTTAMMLQRLETLNETAPIRFMLFDFVELGGDTGQNEELRISSIHRHLKAIAKTLDIPVWGLSQLSREVERRADKMPQLSDLRYSGMGEAIADRIAFLMRPEYYIKRQVTLSVPEADRQGIAYVLVAKNRNGPAGMVRLRFDEHYTRFSDPDALQEPV